MVNVPLPEILAPSAMASEIRVSALLPIVKTPVVMIPPLPVCRVSGSRGFKAPTVISPVLSVRPIVIPEKPSTKLLLNAPEGIDKSPAPPAIPIVLPLEMGLIVSMPVLENVE